MFTGIVEAIGTIKSTSSSTSAAPSWDSGGVVMTIHSPPPILAGVRQGDSISVNGTCLTVTAFKLDGSEEPTSTPGSGGGGAFTVGLAPETLRRTNLGQLSAGSRVNLERAMGSGSGSGTDGGGDDGPARFGGHYVQGHVDCVAEVLHVQMDGDSRRMRFSPARPSIMRYIVEKGFVCVDGASLTVTAVGGGGGGGGGGGDDSSSWFEVMLVAYTQEKIVTAAKCVGELVNVEVDLTGKLVEKQVTAYLEGAAVAQQLEALVERAVERKLREAGLVPPPPPPV